MFKCKIISTTAISLFAKHEKLEISETAYCFHIGRLHYGLKFKIYSQLVDVQSFVWVSHDLLNEKGCISGASTSEYAAGYLPLCGEAMVMGKRQPMVLARKGGSFSKVSHLTAPASATYRRSSQPSAKTY